jgi:hypothetical protein
MSLTNIETFGDVLRRLQSLELDPDEYRDWRNAILLWCSKMNPAASPEEAAEGVRARGLAAMNALEAVDLEVLGIRSEKTRRNRLEFIKKAVATAFAGTRTTTRWEKGAALSPVGAVWAATLARDPREKGDKVGAIRLGKCAEALGFLPDQLPVDFHERFRVWQLENSWRPNAEKTVHHSCTAWNRLVRTGRVAGLAVQLPEPEVIHPPIFDSSPTAYPRSFQDDVTAYKSYMMDPATWCQKRRACQFRAKPYKERTVGLHIQTLRILAGSLVASGFPKENIDRISTLARGENPARIMENVEEREKARILARRAAGVPDERGDEKTTSQLSLVKDFRTIVYNWCNPQKLPDGTDPTAEMFKRLKNGALESTLELPDGSEVKMRIRPKKGLSAKNRRRLAALTGLRLKSFLALPEAEMKRIDNARDGRPTPHQAKSFETALVFAFQLRTPSRKQDVPLLRRSMMIETPDGGAEITYIANKNDKEVVIVLEPELRKWFEIYWTIYRPVLLGGAPDLAGFIFPSRKGGAGHAASIGRRVIKLIKRKIGVRWNMHLNRHNAARIGMSKGMTLDEVADALGIDIATAKKFYAPDRKAHAARKLDRAIFELRDDPVELVL